MAMALWGKITYSSRLFLWLVGYSVLLVSCVFFFQYRREKDFKAEEMNARLQILNEQLLHHLEDESFDIDSFTAADFENLRISVIDTAGHVVYDNSLDSLPNTNHLSRKEISEALRSGTGYTLRRHSQSTGENYFYSARMGHNGVIVRTAVPYSLSLHSLLQADRGFLWFLAILTVTMCAVGYFATHRMGMHIRRLKLFAESAEKGAKIYDKGPFPHDELGEISNNIVRLYASLQQAISERDREHSAAMHEQQEKERIKKQLTNNINHELKTPVASIQICLETLLAHPDMSEEKRREFLERSLANNQRLKQLLDDVSLITRMEDGAGSIAREEVDLADIIRNVVAEMTEAAETHGFVISNNVAGTIKLRGNQSLLESVFYNLIDNAISYSGGSRITISRSPSAAGRTIITLSDNGCGVADEHLPRLFERFYRVDKGRSRAAGGTGLGLSIVKNAVQFHGGTISVTNNPRGGLQFRISLPDNGVA